MAQTEQEIIDDMGAAPSGFVFAQLADWVLWRSFFANAIALFESILDRTKSDIDTIIATQKLGSKSWYAKKIMEFQNGDSLTMNEDTGMLEYVNIDTSKQIIARCSVGEKVVENVSHVVFKAAKYNNLDDKVLVPLDVSTELPNLETYVENVKITGTDTLVVSTASDLVKMIGSIYYDPAYNPAEVIFAVKQALINYRDTLGGGALSGIVKKHEFYTKIAGCLGVYAVDLDTLQHKTSTGEYGSIESSAELEAGYFNYDVDNAGFSLAFKNYKTDVVNTTITDLNLT
ncbi:MAG: hypothetical protein JEY96_17025 [Bacteroidales bacterium]|nr:hypothetical protein [Bacteroidales bacterium]